MINNNKNIYDTVEEFYGSMIQHGPFNDRIYVMDVFSLSGNQVDLLIKMLFELSRQHDYSKIFCKVPENILFSFINKGFKPEAEVPGFYKGTETGFFLSKYLKAERELETDSERMNEILDLCRKKSSPGNVKTLPDNFSVRKCVESDVIEMAGLYRKVFATYPFPIYDPDYLVETMKTHVDYYCITTENQITALSSAEKDLSNGNAEMTDFATLPEFRGHGFASLLLSVMEKDMMEQNIMTAYTIARSVSPGMNITFAGKGYSFAGRLKNNTNISGDMESMNIWYKTLKSQVRP